MSRRAFLSGALRDADRMRALVSECARSQPGSVGALIADIMQHFVLRCGGRKGRCAKLAVYLLERVHRHTGPSDEIQLVLAPTAAEPMRGSWLDASTGAAPARKPPPEAGRVRRFLRDCAFERLGHLPPCAVVCPERARGQVDRWRGGASGRSSRSPPLSLIRALVHDSSVPTALASDGDHFWLLAQQRWVSPTEMMRLFAVPAESGVWSLAVDPASPLGPRRFVEALGRAVHVLDAKRALAVLREHVVLPDHVRYASAYSGIDLFACALDSGLAPGATWSYVAAAECDSEIADFLSGAHASHGLTRGRIAPDATDEARASQAPPADLWFCSPTCGPFSPRNHTRCAEAQEEAALGFGRSLAYPRFHRPRGSPTASAARSSPRCSSPSRARSGPRRRACSASSAPRGSAR